MATVVNTAKLLQEIENDRKSINQRIAEFAKQLENELLEKEAAYRYLLKLEGKTPAVLTPLTISTSHSERITRPLSAEVKDKIWAFVGSDFTNADVESVLGKEGIRPRITNELTKLVEQGILECVHVGKGRTPSRFKVKDAGHDLV